MNSLRPYTSFILSVWLLVSSSGMILNMHFCGEVLRAAGLSEQLDACPMHTKPTVTELMACCKKEVEAPKTASCHTTNALPTHSDTAKDDCCKNTQLSLDVEIQSLAISSLVVPHIAENALQKAPNSLFSAILYSSFSGQQAFLRQLKSSPPLILPNAVSSSSELAILKQSFLI